MPTDRHAPLVGRERAILCGVGGELMQHHGHRLTCLRLQNDFGAANLSVVAGGVRCKLAANEFCKRYPIPPAGAQQLVCCCHRANASIERRYEIGDRSAALPGVGNNSADGRERVLDAMVELGQQSALLFLHPLALGDVNADADDSVWVASAAKGKETARLDPSQLACRTRDTILDVIFAPAGSECLTAALFYPSYVVGVHAGQAFTARDLGGAFRKAMDGRIAGRNLHDLRVGVISVGTNKPSLCCQGKLYVAFGQCQFCKFALRNVNLDSDPSYRLASFVV